jgi:recombination protein RecA
MDRARRRELETTITAIQHRWGSDSIYQVRRKGRQEAIPAVSTGLEELDAALGIGGLPLGQLCELIGVGTAGHLTVALRTLHQAQRAKRTVLYVDLQGTIDLDYLSQCGIRFEALIVLRSTDGRQALEAARDLVDEGATGAVLVDRTHRLIPPSGQETALVQAMRRLRASLQGARGLALFVTEAPGSGRSSSSFSSSFLSPYFAVRLHFSQRGWVYRGRRVAGIHSDVMIVKNAFGPAGRSLRLIIPLGRGRLR